MRFFISACLIAVSLTGAAQCSKPSTSFSDCSFTPIAHRGYSLYYPENTLRSIEEAFKRGVTICEVDVIVTADDRYVLFHDAYALHRTTNGTGSINDKTLAELRTLDAGSWKDAAFAGEKIPTLEEALLIAQKYNGRLYLDTKDYRPDLMKRAIDSTGVDPFRLMPSLTSVNQAAEFRLLLPNTPWIWYNGGLYPDDPTDASFYTLCVALGCYAFEIAMQYVDAPEWETFSSNVHAVGSEVWVFTENNSNSAKYLINKGVDGIETDRPWELARLICDNENLNYTQHSTTGSWRFSQTFGSTGEGPQIRPVRYLDVPASQMPVMGTSASFGISGLESPFNRVMKVPAQDPDNGLYIYTNFNIDSASVTDDSFTVLMDLLIPEESAGKWISLFQTTSSNGDDGDLFINPSGQIGIIGDYFGSIAPNTWYRIAFTVDYDKDSLKIYLNGSLLGSISIFGTRWTVFNNALSGEKQGFMLLADNDGETALTYLASLQVRDYVLSDADIQALGGPSAIGIKSGNAGLSRIGFDGVSQDKILKDEEKQTYYVEFPAGYNTKTAGLNYLLPYGATASIGNGSPIDISNGEYELQVTSQDQTRTQAWRICASVADGLEETAASGFLLYPNPAGDHFVLQYVRNQPMTVEIHDITGKMVLTARARPGEPIAVKTLAPGMYTIKAEAEGSVYQARLIRN